MVTQRTFNTRLFIYLLTSGLFTYLPTSGLLTSGYLLLIYLLIYLHLMAYGHIPFSPRYGNFVRVTMPKPRGLSVVVSSCTICSVIVF